MAKSAIDLSYQHRPYNKNLDHFDGDDGLPIIGTTFELLTKPYELADRLYKNYGPIARSKTLSRRYLMCTGADINRQVYLDPERNFSAMMGYEESLVEFYGGGLLVRDFDNHKLHRRIFQTAFKNETLRLYTDVMNPIMKSNITSWEKMPKFHFFPHIKATLMEIAAKTFIGIDDLSGDEAKDLAHSFEELTEGMLGLIRWDSPLMFFGKWRKGKQAMRRMEKYFIDQIPSRRASKKMDMFSIICREKDENGNYFPDRDIASHISFLLFAAHDTTTSNLCYVMQYLGQNLEWQNKARKASLELNKPFLDFDDLAKMELLNNIHHEALRLKPSVMIMVRRTIKDCEIAGVKVPADTLINIFPQYTHMMKEHWSEPEKFDPDRFGPERSEHKRHPFQYIPFGGGAHKCIGIHFAGMLMKCFTHQMLLHFDWQVPEGYHPEHQIFPMPRQKDGLPLFLTKRIYE